jgi:Dolichyl-phosphate-mannose-protein mannosyltransferase/PA14 domain
VRDSRKRQVLLAIDALFGLLLLLVAFGAPLPWSRPSDSPQPAAAPSTTAEEVARFGALWQPGQTSAFALADDGGLAIVDRGRQVVMRLDSSGRPITEWGPRFGPDLDAVDLIGIAADGDGWYVLDRGALRILRLDASGRAIPDRTIDLSSLATYGPTALATDQAGNLYMADTGRDRVLVFDPKGRQVRSIGEPGNALGQLKQPMALAFGPDGALFVSDWENSRIQRFSPDDFRTTDAWQVPSHAWGLAVDRLGRVYAPDTDRRLVRLYGADGQLLTEIGGETWPLLHVDSLSQVAVAEDGAWLWVLGRDALARVDLAPYAALRPLLSAEGVRVPLAVLGFFLLGLAGAAVVWPRLRRPGSAPVRVAPPRAPASLAQPVPVVESKVLRAPSMTGLALLGLGAVGAVFATLQLTDPLAIADPWWRLGTLALSGLVFAAGCNQTSKSRPLIWIADWPCSSAKVADEHADRQRIGLGLGAAVLAAIAAVVWWQFRFQTPEATRGALAWLAAVLLVIAAVTRPTKPGLTRWTLVPWVLFVAAFVPRVWSNIDLPYGVWFDEAQAGLEARRFLQQARFTPITDTYGRDASGFYYLLAAVLHIVNDPVLASRGLAALLGALNVPLVYLLGRELFGWRVGIAAAVLLAASRWHLDVSRLGWGPITWPVCATLAFWLLARAVRTSRPSDGVWAGLALGLGIHGYIGFRIMPAVALLLLVYGAWRQYWSVPQTLGRLALVVGSALLVALPVLIFAIQDPLAFNGRFGQTVIVSLDTPQAQKLQELWTNVQKHALMFHVSGDMNGRHNIPGWPMLDPISGLLVVLGLAWLLLRPLDWRSVLAVLWAAAAMSGGILTLAFEAPQAMRTLGITPLLALLAALGLVLVFDRLVALLPTIRLHTPVARVAQLAAAAVLAGIAIWGVATFFNRQMTDPRVWESFSTRETIPARVAAERGASFEAILASATIAPTVQAALLAPEWRDKIRVFDATGDLPYRNRGPALVLLEAEHDTALADEVARYYPAAARRSIGAPDSQKPLVEELQLDSDVLDAQRGFMAVFTGADGTRAERQERSAELRARDAPVPLPAQVSARMGLMIDQPGAYGVRVSDGFRLGVDGETVPASGARVELARGNHVLTVDGTLTSDTPLVVSWQPPDGTERRPIDRGALFVAPEGGNGLEATFYPSRTWEGTPQEKLIDPILDHYYHLNPFQRRNVQPRDSWSVEWRGFIDVPATGSYAFEVERISRAGLWINEQLVFDDTPEGSIEKRSGAIELSAGRHPIRVRLQNRADGGPRVYLFWIPPGGQREVVPGRVLYPPLPRLS